MIKISKKKDSNVTNDSIKDKEKKKGSKESSNKTYDSNDKANMAYSNLDFKNIKTTKPKMSYYNSKTKYADIDDNKNILRKVSGVPYGLNLIPPSFHNAYEYPHRKHVYDNLNNNRNDGDSADDSGYLRIGSCIFRVPPEFIHVTGASGSSAISTMRSSGSLITKNSYIDREITVNLILNGMDQINGYKVDSPFGYPHYLDGLRALLGQFKFTPFIPVENIYLNVQNDIHTVALKNITVETVENFPTTLMVKLVMKEFNSMAYTQFADVFLDDYINWDLFNFYIQRNIRDDVIGLKRIEKGHLDDGIVFKLLNPEVLKTYKNSDDLDKRSVYNKKTKKYETRRIDLTDDSNYEVYVDTKKRKLRMTKLTFATGNKLPKVQLSYHESPTYQFMGGTDTEFVMQFETTDESDVLMMNELYSNNLSMVRENKDKSSLGFIKVENDLINLTGTSHIIIDDLSSSTVPGFPGMYTISVSGRSFDVGQKDREKFKAFRPFYGKGEDLSNNKRGDSWFTGRMGERKDLISQSKRGLANKVIQDAAVEAKLMCTELYPDLRLPKYSAVDWALSKIIKWRKSHGLDIDGIPKKLPRPKTIIPGRGSEEVEYNGFVDPDFYVFYNGQSYEADLGGQNVDSISSKNKSLRSDIFGNGKDLSNLSNDEVKNSKKVVEDKVKSGEINTLTPAIVGKPTVDKVVEPEFIPGYEPESQVRFHRGDVEVKSDDEILIDKLNKWVKVSVNSKGPTSSWSGELGTGQTGDNTRTPKSVKRVTGNPFVDLLINRAEVGCGYVFGATERGDIATKEYINTRRAQYGSVGGWESAYKWIGRQVFDCSAFVCYGLIHVGARPKGYRVSSACWGSGDNCTPINRKDARPGDVFYGGGHIVVYIGNGKVVQASCHERGCTIGSASYWSKGSKCRNTSRINGLEEACKKFLEANPGFYSDGGSASSSDKQDDKKEEKKVGPLKSKSGIGKVPLLETPLKSVTETIKSDLESRTDKGKSGSNGGSDFNKGEPILGKFGGEVMEVQLVDNSKREKSSKNRYYGSKADRYDNLIIKYCKNFNLDPNFIKTILMIESGGDPNCYNGIPSEPCKGLLQMHQTYFPLPNPYDPEQNIRKGCEVLYNYGAYKNPHVGFDKKKWISCFNRGPGNLAKQLRGVSPEPVETLNYYRKFDVFYARLVASGGKPGGTVTALTDGKVPPKEWYKNGGGSGSSESSSTAASDIEVKVWFELSEGGNSVRLNKNEYKNLNAKVDHSGKLERISSDEVGADSASSVAASSGGDRKTSPSPISRVSSEEHRVDSIPTQEEFGIAELDSLSDGELNFDRNKVCNTKAFKNDEFTVEKMFVDECKYGMKGRLARAFPSYMFLIIDEHMGWVDEKKLWSNYYLYQSALEINVHEGYNSPISTAKVVLSNVNRNIREVNKGDSLTELILGKDKAVGGGDSEYSLLDQLSYIYFGSVLNDKVTDSMLEMRNKLYDEIFIREGLRIHIRLGYGSNPANYAPTFSGVVTEVVDGGDLVTIAAQSDGAELVSTSVTDRTNATNSDANLPQEPSDIIASLLCNRENEFLYGLTGGRWYIDNTYGINHFGFYSSGHKDGSLFTDRGEGQFFFRRDRLEYDIVKNIYYGTYAGKYIYEPSVLNFDGETNMKFFCYNRTPWDVMKMCEKMNPEFVCYPRPFGLENRIFFGLPWWQHKYRYERDDKHNMVYELAKPFAQVNMITSISDIIDNRIKVDTSNLDTNMIGVYSLGGDLASTPLIMSDKYIDRSKQSTRTIDTTSTQNFKGLPSFIDKGIEWLGIHDNGKHNAIRTCISELIDSWKCTYSGQLITLGNPAIRAHNYIYLYDMYANMNGTCTVRDVVHSLSGDNGYTTTIVPGLVATSTMKNSGASGILKTITQVGQNTVALGVGTFLGHLVLKAASKNLAFARIASGISNHGPKAISFIKTRGSNILTLVKQGRAISKVKDIGRTLRGSMELCRTGSKLLKIGEGLWKGAAVIGTGVEFAASGVAAVLTGGASIIASLVIGAIIDKAISTIFEMFAYDNCINVYPLYIEGRPLIGGASGQKKLYPYSKKE